MEPKYVLIDKGGLNAIGNGLGGFQTGVQLAKAIFSLAQEEAKMRRGRNVEVTEDIECEIVENKKLTNGEDKAG